MNLEFADNLDDDEYPDEPDGGDDWDDDDPTETVTCPSCHAEIYEDAEQCPACGDYITRTTKLPSIWWWTSIGLLAAIVLFVWMCGADLQ